MDKQLDVGNCVGNRKSYLSESQLKIVDSSGSATIIEQFLLLILMLHISCATRDAIKVTDREL